MALPLNNNAEGGTSGTAPTVANSGGASGDAWDVVTSTGTGATLTYESAQAAHGSLSYQYVSGTVSQSLDLRWNTQLGTITTELWGRFYLYATANPGVAIRPMRLFNGTTLACGIDLLTTGVLRTRDSAGVKVTGAVAIALSAWNRVEWHMTVGASGATTEAKLFKTMDSTTADETLTNTAGNTLAQWTAISLSQAFGTSWTDFMDDFNVNQTGYPGPVAGKGMVFPDPRWHVKSRLLTR